MEVKLGRYRHFKGDIYEVIGIGQHTERDETLVLYKKHSEEKIWVRPINMFLETVEKEGKRIPRFQYID